MHSLLTQLEPVRAQAQAVSLQTHPVGQVPAGDVDVIVSFERDGVPFLQTQQSNTVYPTWPSPAIVDETEGRHSYEVCMENGGGGPTLCTTAESFTNPAAAWPPPRETPPCGIGRGEPVRP